jgi:CVNH domain-containing protein
MTFIQSAENVRLDEGHILRAQLRNMDGELIDSEIDLDHVIGNDFGKYFPLSCFASNTDYPGHFRWEGQSS